MATRNVLNPGRQNRTESKIGPVCDLCDILQEKSDSTRIPNSPNPSICKESENIYPEPTSDQAANLGSTISVVEFEPWLALRRERHWLKLAFLSFGLHNREAQTDSA